MLGLNGNQFRAFFNNHHEGRGIWKWHHYLDIYERHFSRLRGRDVHILEIGVYSGGSLDMWHDYFGASAYVYGVDLEAGCKRYQDEKTRIFIGDQADRNFWREFKIAVPALDIVVDDGGHTPKQQQISMEELLPHLRPGGVYLCEDVHGENNKFACHVYDMAKQLNSTEGLWPKADGERRLVCTASPFQSSIYSVCLYPYVAVIEKTEQPVAELYAPRRGTEWIDGHGP